MKQRRAVLMRHPHAVWALVMFVMIYSDWWANWEFRFIAWALPMYAYTLITPTLAFFACTLLVPPSFEQREVDLEEHFSRIRSPFFGVSFAGLVSNPTRVETWTRVRGTPFCVKNPSLNYFAVAVLQIILDS